MHVIHSKLSESCLRNIKLNGYMIQEELDTDAGPSILHLEKYTEIKTQEVILPIQTKLMAANGERLMIKV